MVLPSELVSEFVKITNDISSKKSESLVYGTVASVDANGKDATVNLDGSNISTPVSTMVEVRQNERVMVQIKDHSATVIGNVSSPAMRLGTLDEFEANLDSLYATYAEIETLVAGYATIENLNATNATIANLNTVYATIENLNATNATIANLNSVYATIGDLNATNASITNLSSSYATINFSNIGTAAIENLYTKWGIIENGFFSDGTFTGDLKAVRINGNLITASTLCADRLIIRGEDGLYYQLNAPTLTSLGLEKRTVTVTDDQGQEQQVVQIGKDENGTWTPVSADDQTAFLNRLHGDNIIAQSVTADKISVTDLVAFGATIGGLTIANASIHSYTKDSINNTTNGLYIDSDGQMALGNATNYIKYYIDGNNNYQLDIRASSFTFGANNQTVQEAFDAAMANNNISSLISGASNSYYGVSSTGSLYQDKVVDTTRDVLFEDGTSLTVKFENANSYISGDPSNYWLHLKVKEVKNYTVSKVEGETYCFKQVLVGGVTYYSATNLAASASDETYKSTTAHCVVNFTVSETTDIIVRFDYNTEYNSSNGYVYDYGTIYNIDTNYDPDNPSTGVKKEKIGGSNNTDSVTFSNVSTGNHSIYIMYKKDDSQNANSGDETFRFKLEFITSGSVKDSNGNYITTAGTWKANDIVTFRYNITNSGAWWELVSIVNPEAHKVAENFLSFDSANGLLIYDRTANTMGKNLQLTSSGINIRNGSTTLASFTADTIELGKNSSSSVINFCNGNGILKVTDNCLHLHSNNITGLLLSGTDDVITRNDILLTDSAASINNSYPAAELVRDGDYSNDNYNYSISSYSSGYSFTYVYDDGKVYYQATNVSATAHSNDQTDPYASTNAYCILGITVAEESEVTINFDYNTESSSWDYGTIYEMDSGMNVVKKDNIGGADGTDSATFENVSPGTRHTIYIRYHKDSSVNPANEKFRFYVSFSKYVPETTQINLQKAIRLRSKYGLYYNNEKMIYTPGTYVDVRVQTCGFVTTGRKEIFFNVPIQKPLFGVSSVSVSGNGTNGHLRLRQYPGTGEGYIGGSTGSTYIYAFNYEGMLDSSTNTLTIRVQFSEVLDGSVNNSPCGVDAFLRIVFL